MPTGCFDYLSDPCVQDMLRRRDETIEILRDEISEINKQVDHWKWKYEKVKDEERKFSWKIFFGWFLIWILVLYLVIIIIQWLLI